MLHQISSDYQFPTLNSQSTIEEPLPGLVAYGGDLSVECLLSAYKKGIFPWFSKNDPDILWWSPDPRAILYPQEYHYSKSTQKYEKKMPFTITYNAAFEEVIFECNNTHSPNEDAWLTDEMQWAYINMHHCKHALSVEVWLNNTLVGGTYGVAIPPIFFAESMFSKSKNTSKIALFYLCQYLTKQNFFLIDCQFLTPHLSSLGVRNISRNTFLSILSKTIMND